MVIQPLVDSGLPGPEAVHCYGFLVTYTIGFASYQMPRQWGLSGSDGLEQRRRCAHVYADLSIEGFPTSDVQPDGRLHRSAMVGITFSGKNQPPLNLYFLS